MNPKALHILLVEDNADHAELLRRSWETLALPAHFHQVEDGETALDYLFHRKLYADRAQFPDPDLVLLDLRLPRLDGLQVLRALKSRPETRALRVIMLTTSNTERDMATAIELGANHFLTKPAEPGALAQLIHQLNLPQNTSYPSAESDRIRA